MRNSEIIFNILRITELWVDFKPCINFESGATFFVSEEFKDYVERVIIVWIDKTLCIWK